MAAWAFVAQFFADESRATILALAVLATGFIATLVGARRIATNQRTEFRALRAVPLSKPVPYADAVALAAKPEYALRTPAWLGRLEARRAIRRLVRAGVLVKRDAQLLRVQPDPVAQDSDGRRSLRDAPALPADGSPPA